MYKLHYKLLVASINSMFILYSLTIWSYVLKWWISFNAFSPGQVLCSYWNLIYISRLHFFLSIKPRLPSWPTSSLVHTGFCKTIYLCWATKTILLKSHFPAASSQPGQEIPACYWWQFENLRMPNCLQILHLVPSESGAESAQTHLFLPVISDSKPLPKKTGVSPLSRAKFSLSPWFLLPFPREESTRYSVTYWF